MAVISCNLMREGRSGNFDVNSGRDYTVQWQVLTNNDNDGPLVVLSNGPFVGPNPTPVRGAIYSVGDGIDGFAFCRRINAVNRPGRVKEWTVTATYEMLQPGEQHEDTVSQNPITRPVHYWIEHESWTRTIEKDKDGVAIKNSAGVPFDNAVELEDSYAVLVAEKNYATLQEIINLNTTFSMKVNTDVYKGAVARTLLCRPIACSDIQNENGISYYRATFHLAYKPDKWDVDILDAGFTELNGGLLRDILDKNKQPVSEPFPLNGAGVALPVGQPLVFLTKRIRGEVAFSGLGV